MDTRLVHAAFDPAAELASFSADGAGAVASFTGLARDTTRDGGQVTAASEAIAASRLSNRKSALRAALSGP